MKEYKIVVIGAGIAGISPLLYLEAENELMKYLEKGICVIEKNPEIGAGKFQDYSIQPNTESKVFVELFQNSSSELFNMIINKPIYKKLFETSNLEDLRLTDIANLFNDLGRGIESKIRRSSNSNVFCQSEVLNIQKKEGKGYLITYKCSSTNLVHKVCGEHIIVNLGGKHRKTIQQSKVITAAELLTKQIESKISNLLNDHKRITFIGNSHSSMSIIAKIIESKYFTKNHEVTVYGRKPIKLFYENEDLAKADGYQYDSQLDVCKLTKRVNRYSGMRGNSFIVARNILKNRWPNIKVMLISDETIDISKFEITIDCTGYESKFLPIYDENLEEIKLSYNNGILDVNKHFNPITNEKKVLPNIYTYGLGVGILPTKEIGGELEFKRRVDGVWLYQNYVAPKIVKNIT